MSSERDALNKLKPLRFSQHTLLQMAERGATEEEVLETVRSGEQVPAKRADMSSSIQIQVQSLAIKPVVPIGCEQPVSETLPVVVERIVRELQPERIVLFGSYAEGTPTSHSDVDLLIVLDTDAPLKDRSWEVSRLLIPRPFPVDILVRTPREIEQGLAKGDTFLCQILTSGKVLYERRK